MYIIILKILFFIFGCLVMLFCIGLAIISDLKKELKNQEK